MEKAHAELHVFNYGDYMDVLVKLTSAGETTTHTKSFGGSNCMHALYVTLRQTLADVEDLKITVHANHARFLAELKNLDNQRGTLARNLHREAAERNVQIKAGRKLDDEGDE